MAKPVTLPRFAETAGEVAAANITEPSSGQKDTGWVLNQIPTSAGMNWIHYWTYQWIQYLNTLEAESLTWTSLHTFNGGAEFYGSTSVPGLQAEAAAHASGVGISAFGTSTVGSIGIKAGANHASNYAIVAFNEEQGAAIYAGVQPGGDAVPNHSGVYALAKGTGYGVLGEAISTAGGVQGKVGAASGSADVWGVHGNGNVNGTGVYGIGGSSIGDGVRAVAGNAVWPALRATGFASSSGSRGADVFGGTGTTLGGIGLSLEGGNGVTNGSGGIGLNVIGGAGAGTGNAGVAINATPGTKASGTHADAIVVNAPGGGAYTADSGFFGLKLAAGMEVKFNGTRTNYTNLAGGYKNILTAKNIVNAWGRIRLNPAGTITLTDRYNISSAVFSSGGAGPYVDVAFSGTFSDANYCLVGNVSSGALFSVGSRTTTGFQFELISHAGVSLDATLLAGYNIDFIVLGNMAP